MKGRDIILGILKNGEKTGYEINSILQNQLSYFYDGTYGMIYPTLRKLESENKIIKKVVNQSDRPNKKVYSITDEGIEEFHKYLSSPVINDVYKSDFLMRLFFGDDLSKKKIVSLIKEEIGRKNSKLKTLVDNYELWKSEGISFTQEITVKYGISQYKSIVAMLENELSSIQNKSDK
ncbi:PadR family transcriptional regulator [Apilactobacillus quenuiae]|uniref:PadR family transcriptional regulator n=1 Tax=Apilactobacillus quenuiae TaxID=2008377 RepID=UPI000D015440|nr:PadR family transcriptional regulator [Apilactobacillus quenuiae]